MNKAQVDKCFSRSENAKKLFYNTNSNHLPILDSFRALSVHWVFGFHILYIFSFFVPEPSKEAFFQETSFLLFFWRGTLGVDIFFVISGFLITQLMIEEYKQTNKINIFRFYKRRFLRLMPVYYVAIFIMAVGFLGEFEQIQKHNVQSIWTNFLYINNYVDHLDQFMLWTWSLAVEEQFYLLYPPIFILLYKFKKNIFYILLTLLPCSLILRYLSVDMSAVVNKGNMFLLDVSLIFFDTLYDKLHTRVGAIVCGIIAAFWFSEKQKIAKLWIDKLGMFTMLIELILISSLIATSLIYFNTPSSTSFYYLITFRTIFSCLLAALLLLYLIGDQQYLLLKKILEHKIWYPFAQLSYSNYIWHPMVIFPCYYIFWVADRALSFNEILLTVGLSYVITMILSYLSFVFIEKPFMNLRKFVT